MKHHYTALLGIAFLLTGTTVFAQDGLCNEIGKCNEIKEIIRITQGNEDEIQELNKQQQKILENLKVSLEPDKAVK